MNKFNPRNAVVRLAVVAFVWTAGGLGVAWAGDPNSKVVFAGVGVQEDVIAGFAGGIWALNGDLDTSGVLLRGFASYVDYDFSSAVTPDGEANGEFARGSISLGYQFASDKLALSVYGGIDFQDRDIDPSVADTGELDDDTGFIGTARLATLGPTLFPASIEGNYSTANDQYYVQARIARDFGTIDFGPEVAVLGNEDYDAVRVGAHVSFDLGGGPIIQISAGYHFADDETGISGGSGDSAYGNTVLVFVF